MRVFRFVIIFNILLPFFLSINAQDSTQVEQPEPTQAIEQATDAAPAPAPKKQKAPIKDKIYFGGYVNLSFGSYTVIGIEPMIGYKLTPKLSLGIKIRYDYISDKRYEPTRSYSNYGGSVFARYRVVQPLYLHVEYAAINYEYFNNITLESQREWVPFLFVGAGYSQRMGGNAWLNAQILFDVLQSSKSPYNNWEPFYSIGVSVGF
jgi:hypothetical protein